MKIEGDRLHIGYIISFYDGRNDRDRFVNQWQSFIVLDVKPFDKFGLELFVEDQRGVRQTNSVRVDDTFTLVCDCGKGNLCPEFGHLFVAEDVGSDAATIREGVKSRFFAARLPSDREWNSRAHGRKRA